MTQTAAILTRTGTIQLELPAPDAQLMDGVEWGAVDAFPTPAYWQCQVIARRLAGQPAGYKLGRTLAEEVGACLLGGHGIPASIGIAAFEKLRALGAFSEASSEKQLETWLAEPLKVGPRSVRYRFAAQKARYLAAAIPCAHAAPSFATGRQLRDWLTQLRGVGLKTASWIARNWMDADDVAILDIHIIRVGQAIGLFPKTMSVERHYLELEERFLKFSYALDVRTSELDAVVWYEMASSPAAVRVVMDQLRGESSDQAKWGGNRYSRQSRLTLV
ncbi:MAG: 8-oxoguanine DNA glycosylase [Nevskiaceae bacterium]|nr:MAG: 8-oxoguanine DNA glycosylase [Nevskiaceae bacterium]